MKRTILIGMILIVASAKAQLCECEKEFLYIQNVVEHNFAGYSDRMKAISKEAYIRKTNELLKLTHDKFASDNCVLIISQYLDIFKSHHLGFSSKFDPTITDTDFVNHRPIFELDDEKIKNLMHSKSWEGVYISTYDSSTKIALIKDPTPLHD